MTRTRDLAQQGDAATTAEMEAGTETDLRGMSPALVNSAITAVAGVGGSATVSSGTDATLSSDVHQSVSATASGLVFSVRDVSGIGEGKLVHLIRNDGGYPFIVTDDGGTRKWFLVPGKKLSLFLVDDATANGVWLANVTAPSISTDQWQDFDNNVDGMAICPLDTDKVLIAFGNGDDSDHCYVQAGTVATDGTWTFGTAIEVFGAAINHVACAQVDTDKALVVTNSTTELRAHLVTVSGTTCTEEDDISFKHFARR